MNKHLITIGICLLSFVNLNAAIKDTVNTKIREYKDELGFFQKADRDLGDPRFMFYDDKGKIDFGIGGTAALTGMIGFGGQCPWSDFIPGAISVPSDYTVSSYARLNDTELHFKARTYFSLGKNKTKHKIIAFIKIGAKDDNSIELKQAYISIDGLSIGRIPTFFSDLEAGVMTTGVPKFASLDKTHPLIGYTHRFDEHWRVSASVERNDFNMANWDNYYNIQTQYNIYANYQAIPDFTLAGKYKWKNGHVRLSALFRGLSYRAMPNNQQPVHDKDGKNFYEFGYGFALSGNIKPTDKFKISWNFVGGKGISDYIKPADKNNLEIAICDERDADGYSRVTGVPMFSSFLGLQYNWSEQFNSSITGGYTKSLNLAGYYRNSKLNDCFYVGANLFWNISDFAYAGLEYMFGSKNIYNVTLPPDTTFGYAHRVALTIAYCF